MRKENRERLALRMQPETRRKIEQWYREDNCRRQNEFVEKAVNFYADYLAANDNNALLPSAILSVVEGRIGLLEKHISALTFNHAVELDMLVGIAADVVKFDADDLKRRRAQSVKNVKNTNGRISLERRARSRDEGDEWQN